MPDIGWLHIDNGTWENRVSEVMAEYGCAQDEAEDNLRAEWHWTIDMPGVTYNVPVEYIVAHGDNEEAIERYLGFGAHLIGVRVGVGPRSIHHTWAVIEIPAQHAQWQAGRLASGLHGGARYSERRAAMDQMEELSNT